MEAADVRQGDNLAPVEWLDRPALRGMLVQEGNLTR